MFFRIIRSSGIRDKAHMETWNPMQTIDSEIYYAYRGLEASVSDTYALCLCIDYLPIRRKVHSPGFERNLEFLRRALVDRQRYSQQIQAWVGSILDQTLDHIWDQSYACQQAAISSLKPASNSFMGNKIKLVKISDSKKTRNLLLWERWAQP